MKFIYLVIALSLWGNIAYSDGKIKIKSNVKGAYIFIDGKKRAMTGSGYTTITLKDGEHKILISKNIDEETYQ
jgi:hypothetical protein